MSFMIWEHSFYLNHSGNLFQWTCYLFSAGFFYAEIHYQFKGIYSRLKHLFPEILADAPHRLEPGQKLPVLVIIKDAHLFPIELRTIRVDFKLNGEGLSHKILFDNSLKLDSPFWHRQFWLDPSGMNTGTIELNVTITIRHKKKIYNFQNDNYTGTSHAPLCVKISSSKLPCLPGLFYGDLHTHSNYTSDQVEFGAPLPAIQEAAEAVGLSFVAVTDHSYDLDDFIDNYIKNDPKLTKWKRFRKELSQLNKPSNGKKPIMISGEEVTVRNRRNRNVHFLILNDPRFHKGSGDGAEKWFKFYSESSIPDLLQKIPDTAAAIAAHPAVPVPKLESILINRGKWEMPDILHKNLSGLQILNGAIDQSFMDGLRLWKWSLAGGYKKYIYAGTDAHGNFNRYRQVRFPFFKMHEKDSQILGKTRTGVFADSFSFEAILNALKRGRCFITDGPALNFTAQNENREIAEMGSTISGGTFEIQADFKSTPEFGKLHKIKLLLGKIDRSGAKIQETQLRFQERKESNFRSRIFRKIELSRKEVYLRLEAATDTGKASFSNPIWLELK